MGVIQEESTRLTRIDQLETRPQGERLTQHVKAGLTVPGVENTQPMWVEVSLDTGSGVLTTLAQLLARMKAATSELQPTKPFQRQSRVVTDFGEERTDDTQTRPMHLSVEFLRRSTETTIPFIMLPAPENLVNIGQQD